MINKNIILYSTGCPRCNVLKKKLSEKNITYTENTSTEEMLALGITEVPVLSLDGVLLNFREAVDMLNAEK
jgi:glutaredoxin